MIGLWIEIYIMKNKKLQEKKRFEIFLFVTMAMCLNDLYFSRHRDLTYLVSFT